jgi:proteasome accessory factor C
MNALAARLGRLLTIVPYVLQRDGVTLQELAQTLGVSARQVRADCELLAMVGRPPLTPDRLIDLQIEDDVVFVALDQNLTRPLPLNEHEAWALAVAVAWVGNLAGMPQALDGLWQQLLAQLPIAQQRALGRLRERVVVAQDPAAVAQVAPIVQEAVTCHQVLEIAYYSASSERLRHYLIAPLALLTHGGISYVVAKNCAIQAPPQIFRLARIAKLTLTAQTFVPESVDLERYRTQALYPTQAEAQGVVRLPAASAYALAQATDVAQVQKLADGMLQVHLAAANPRGLCRWALRLSHGAEVCEPAKARATMGEICREAMAAYARPPQKG